jgi:hypothetical protein
VLCCGAAGALRILHLHGFLAANASTFSSLLVSASAPNMQAELNGWNFDITSLVQ